MSHGCLLVISKSPEDVERLLAPYDEDLEVELYVDGDESWMHNPQAKWDYWRIGGRWSDTLRTEDGPCDQAQKHAIDFEAMGLAFMEEAGGDRAMERQVSRGGGLPWDDAVTCMTRDAYQRKSCRFSTLAVVTSDGEWHERGRMGWFGHVFDEADPGEWQARHAALVRAADAESWLTIVDYHI